VHVVPLFNRSACAEAVMKRRLSKEGQMSMRQERMLGVAMLVAGLAIAGVAVSRMGPEAAMHAQATPPTAPSLQDDKPAQSTPGGTRPTTPAPEPARPQNNEGSTTGTAPASPRTGDRPPMIGTPLPPAPAEKTGPPIQSK
jgi:hypothetical protein